METNHQAEILEAMLHPGFYPHPVEAIQRHETHISTVFLTGSWVYKIKKPVNLGFLDFTTLEKRQHFCRQEVTLNRRLTRDVYIDALPIAGQDGAYTLNGSGAAVEFAVKMRQLAASDCMQAHLQQAELDNRRLDALVDLLVDFYARASTDCAMELSGVTAWEENLQMAEAFAGVEIDRQPFAFVRSATHAFYRRHPTLFQRRVIAGKIRDCHGDLRTDHIYFTQNGIQIIDCIEFNPGLRCLDTISDLAFLAMDLDFNHRPATAKRLICLYVERTDDVGALPLLDFYRCYRSMVRCKVSCIRLREAGNPSAEQALQRAAAGRYLALAHAYATAFSRPVLWVVYGLPASGKSTLADALADLFDIDMIRSDIIRKELFSALPTSSAAGPFGKGMYSTYATGVTYERMFALAEEALKKGRSVVIDATFSRAFQRTQAWRIAAHRQATPVFVQCRAPEAILAARLHQREIEPSVSDARLVHLEAFKKRFDPMVRMERAVTIVVDTVNPLAACLRQIALGESLENGLIRKGGNHV